VSCTVAFKSWICEDMTNRLENVVSTSKPVAAQARTTQSQHVREHVSRGEWWRFTLILLITAVVVSPIGVVVLLAFRPGVSSATTAALTTENLRYVFSSTPVLQWLSNSLLVVFLTMLAALVIGAPGGYVLSRGRGKLLSGYALMLFVIKSLPVITAVVPLFIIFAQIGLVDNLVGISIIYISASLAVGVWMFAAYFDSIPISLEEAAWIDGCSIVGGFLRIVLRNSLPGVLSAAIFAFLTAWNDYLVAIVFLRSTGNFTLQVGIQSFFQQLQTDWGSVMALSLVMMAPPVLVFVVLNRFFNIGGIGGALAGS
jgi:multiple sugar transport system permease protein